MTWFDAGGGERIYALDFEDDERIGIVCWCGGCQEDPCLTRDHEAKAYTYGAAALAGVIGMFQAIVATHFRRIETCPLCGKTSSGRAMPLDRQPNEPRWICLECSRAKYAAEKRSNGT